MIDRYNVNKY